MLLPRPRLRAPPSPSLILNLLLHLFKAHLSLAFATLAAQLPPSLSFVGRILEPKPSQSGARITPRTSWSSVAARSSRTSPSPLPSPPSLMASSLRPFLRLPQPPLRLCLPPPLLSGQPTPLPPSNKPTPTSPPSSHKPTPMFMARLPPPATRLPPLPRRLLRQQLRRQICQLPLAPRASRTRNAWPSSPTSAGLFTGPAALSPRWKPEPTSPIRRTVSLSTRLSTASKRPSCMPSSFSLPSKLSTMGTSPSSALPPHPPPCTMAPTMSNFVTRVARFTNWST